MFEIKVTKRAKGDLKTLFNLIFEDKPTSATEYIHTMLQSILLLKENPEMGKECKYKGIQGNCRVLVYEKNYLIIYRVYKEHIIISKIINTKQHKGKK